jgi:hypothetical protein
LSLFLPLGKAFLDVPRYDGVIKPDAPATELNDLTRETPPIYKVPELVLRHPGTVGNFDKAEPPLFVAVGRCRLSVLRLFNIGDYGLYGLKLVNIEPV